MGGKQRGALYFPFTDKDITVVFCGELMAV